MTAAPPNQPPAATVGDLHKLARRALAPTAARFPPHTRAPDVRDALARFGYGLDWLGGEHVVAFLDHGSQEDAFVGLILTDRSLLAGVGDDRLILPIADITAATLSEGILSSAVQLTTRDKATHELTIARDGPTITRLLTDLAALPYKPATRAAPMARVTDDDPTGLHHLVDTLKAPDPRVVALAALAFALNQAGRLPAEAGWDMTVRVQCLHRTLTFGRALQPQLAWLSPLRPSDLAQLLPALHTDPAQVSRSGSSTVIEIAPPQEAPAEPTAAPTLEDRVIERVATNLLNRFARSIGTDLDTLIDAEATLLRLTVKPGPDTRDLTDNAPPEHGGGWFGSKLSALSAMAGPWLGTSEDDLSGPLATYQLAGQLTTGVVDLSRRKPDMARDLSDRLLPLEIRALAWRLLDGWSTSAVHLLTRPDDALRAQLAPHLDPAQVRALVGA